MPAFWLTTVHSAAGAGKSVLKNSSSTAPAPDWRQQLHYRLKEGALIAAVAGCLFLLMTLVSYSSNDPAWDNSVQVHSFDNAGGMIGRLSSILLGSLGYSPISFRCCSAFVHGESSATEISNGNGMAGCSSGI